MIFKPLSGQLLAIFWFFIAFYLHGYFLEVISTLNYFAFVLCLWLWDKQFRVYNNGLNSFISTFHINHDVAINKITLLITMVFFKGPFKQYINKLPWQPKFTTFCRYLFCFFFKRSRCIFSPIHNNCNMRNIWLSYI